MPTDCVLACVLSPRISVRASLSALLLQFHQERQRTRQRGTGRGGKRLGEQGFSPEMIWGQIPNAFISEIWGNRLIGRDSLRKGLVCFLVGFVLITSCHIKADASMLHCQPIVHKISNGWIAIEYIIDMYGSQRMNHTDWGNYCPRCNVICWLSIWFNLLNKK